MWNAWSNSIALVASVDEHRMQGPVEVAAVAEIDHLDRADRIQHFARADRQARRTQHAREVHDIGDKAARREFFALDHARLWFVQDGAFPCGWAHFTPDAPPGKAP